MKNIKTFCLLIALFIVTLNCNAQNIPYHRIDSEADKFAGTWQWGNSTNGIILIMKKENNIKLMGSNDNSLFDVLIGFHKIYKNGQVIEDTTNFSNTNFNDKKRSLVATSEDNLPNQLLINMTHKSKGIKVKIDYIDANHIKIISVRNQEVIRVKSLGQQSYDTSIDIPINIILTKQ